MRDRFQSVSTGLRLDSFPMRLYEKAKRLGTWNPSDIDLSQDRVDWAGLNDDERRQLLYMLSQFQGGEEAVTIELLPLVLAIARERRLEEELFLTTFLFEEGKHMQFFRRWLDEVADSPEGLEFFHFPTWRRIFEKELPASMGRLLNDPSPEALADASVTYNMIVEGVLAETGYVAYHEALGARGIMPGLRTAISHVKTDEARHIAYGVYLLSRLVADDRALWDVIEARMNELYPLTTQLVRESFRLVGRNPFGLEESRFVDHASRHFRNRYERIKRAADRSLDEIEADDLVEAEVAQG